MTLNVFHFDTKVQADTGSQELIKNCLAEYLFPNVDFAVTRIYENATTPEELQNYQDKTAQFSNGEKVYFASQEVREKIYPEKSDGAAYGSLVFTPCNDFKELKDLKVLVVDDETGENGGKIPNDQAKALVGDCYGRVSPELAKELTGTTYTPFQFRLGIKPHEGSEVHRIAKGTLAPAQKISYDLILASSSFKGRKDGSKIELGEHTLSVGIGVKTLAEYGLHSLGTQILVNYPLGMEADILPKVKAAAQRLAEVQSDPRKIAQYFIEKNEKQLQLREQNSDVEEAEAKEPSPDQNFYSLLKNCVESHPQLLEHPNIVNKLTSLIRKEWTDIATGRAIQFQSGLAQPSLELQKNEVCVPYLPEGEKLIVTRSPLINSNGVITLTNKHLPEFAKEQGTIHIHPETAAAYLQADFDGDRLAFERASLYPTLAAEIEEKQLPQNRHTEVIKAEKQKYVADTFGEIALAASSNKIGLIANSIQKAVALQNEVDSLPDQEKSKFLASLKKQCLSIKAIDVHKMNIPEEKKQQCLSIQEKASLLTTSDPTTGLQTAKQIFFETTNILSNELQTAADGPKSAARPNEDILKFANTLLDCREVAWIADKKNQDVYSSRIMKTENYSPVDRMIQVANDVWQEHHLESFPTNQFADFFPKNYSPAQAEIAKQIIKTYNTLYGEATALKKQAAEEPGTQLIATSANSGKQILIRNLAKYNHPDAWKSESLNIKLQDSPSGKLIALAQVKNDPTQWEPLGTVSDQSAKEHNLKDGFKLSNAEIQLIPGITNQEIEAKFKAAQDFSEAVKAEYSDQRHEIQSAIWHTAHASNQKGYENYSKASAAFNIFPELVAERAKEFQFTEITLAGMHQPTNEWGQALNGKTVDFQVALETRETHPNFNKRVILVDGKQVAPISEKGYQLPIGTIGKATLTTAPSATLTATTAKGNTVKITQLSKYDFAGESFSDASATLTIDFVTPVGKDNPVPVVKIEDKILGVIDPNDRDKLKAVNLLRPGTRLNTTLQSNPATTATFTIEKDSLKYPDSWIKKSDASKQAWIEENIETSAIPPPKPDKPYERPEWEKDLVKAAFKTLNSIQPDALGRRIKGMGSYIVLYTENSLERSLRVLDGVGDRGVLYKAQQGERPSIDNFTPKEKQEFSSLIPQNRPSELSR